MYKYIIALLAVVLTAFNVLQQIYWIFFSTNPYNFTAVMWFIIAQALIVFVYKICVAAINNK